MFLGVALLAAMTAGHAQAPGRSDTAAFAAAVSASEDKLPDAPGELSALEVPRSPMAAAMAAGGGGDAFVITPTVSLHQDPLSRVGVGASLSPLGLGVDTAIVLTGVFDARLTGNYFAYNNGRIEVDNFNVNGGLHLSSARASLDLYPFNAPIRLSAGMMFYNQNHASAFMRLAPGASLTMNGQTFYSGPATDPPLTGNAALAFHSVRPAPTLTVGFGKFIPRSTRHWSFPSEIGVAFTGAPTITLAMAGTVCTDVMLTQCSNVADKSNPVGAQFNNALQAKLANWRSSLNRVQVFPIFSGGVSYSFNSPWELPFARKSRF